MDSSFQAAAWCRWVSQLPEEVLRVRPVLCTQYAWALMAERYDGVALDKRSVLDDAQGPARVAAAHAHGLKVNAWTFRDDALAPRWPDREAEYRAGFELGIDALFSDFPDSALEARAAYQAELARGSSR